MTTINERVKALIERRIPPSKRYKALADLTGLSAEVWRAFWNGRQKLSGEMLCLITQHWPQYGFWLATGISDPENGHVSPEDMELPATTAYFLEQMKQMRARSEPNWKGSFEDLKVLETAMPTDWQQAQFDTTDANLNLQNLDETTTRVIEIARQRRLEELRKNREEEKTRSKPK